MFRAEGRDQIIITNSHGERVVSINVSKLRSASLDDLKNEVSDIEEMCSTLSSLIEMMEFQFMETYMFDSLEATRKGLRMYADGTIKRKMDEFKKTMQDLALSLPSAETVKETEAEKEQKEALFLAMVAGAVVYVQNVTTCQKLERFSKIIRAVISEKEALIQDATVTNKISI